ncbi:MAG: transporter, partial [Desulfobacteraceae bacterium]|nr:transporter [Desulfobacteraceae bacterium]
MAGETDLEKLMASMSPCLLPDEYVFCTVADGNYGDYSEYFPLASFLESEGLSLVLTKTNADKAKLNYDSVFKAITLSVHSSLEAVGLTAV